MRNLYHLCKASLYTIDLHTDGSGDGDIADNPYKRILYMYIKQRIRNL